MLPTHNITAFLAIMALCVMVYTYFQSMRTDLARREIPDELSGNIFWSGLFFLSLSGTNDDVLMQGVYTGISFAAVLFVAGWASYKMGWLGGGDVKLWTASAFAFGSQASSFVLLMGLFGFLLALIVLVLQKRVDKKGLKKVKSDDEPMPSNLFHNLGCPELPYGLAIAAAGISLAIYNIIDLSKGIL